MESAEAVHLEGRQTFLAETRHSEQIGLMNPHALDLDMLRRLPVAERLQLVEDLWDSIAVDTPSPEIPMSPELVAELERRLKDLDEGRERAFSWEEVREKILKDTLHGP